MEEQERCAFELWYVGHTFDKAPPEIERDAQGQYRLMQTRQAWNAYHAGWLREGAHGVSVGGGGQQEKELGACSLSRATIGARTHGR
jgi:hypothetical protein